MLTLSLVMRLGGSPRWVRGSGVRVSLDAQDPYSPHCSRRSSCFLNHNIKSFSPLSYPPHLSGPSPSHLQHVAQQQQPQPQQAAYSPSTAQDADIGPTPLGLPVADWHTDPVPPRACRRYTLRSVPGPLLLAQSSRVVVVGYCRAPRAGRARCFWLRCQGLGQQGCLSSERCCW